MDDFSKQKIIWGNLCLNTQFAFAEKEYIINAPTSMIIPGDKYILAILNSNVADFYIRNLGVTRNGGYFEYKPMFIKEMPIPNINNEEKEKYINLVNKIENNYDSIELQNELNSLIYSLYKLSHEEINYLENDITEISSSVKL